MRVGSGTHTSKKIEFDIRPNPAEYPKNQHVLEKKLWKSNFREAGFAQPYR